MVGKWDGGGCAHGLGWGGVWVRGLAKMMKIMKYSQVETFGIPIVGRGLRKGIYN